jgi:hypothetical protein
MVSGQRPELGLALCAAVPVSEMTNTPAPLDSAPLNERHHMKRKQNLGFLNPYCLTLFSAAVALVAACSAEVRAQTPAVDPAATQILKRMTDYLGSLKQFSVNTQGTLETTNATGHRIDLDVSAHAIVSRPNKIYAERRGDLLDQNFHYDGKTLTLCNPVNKVYATVSAPATIEATLDYTREKLDLFIPIGDLVYTNAYALLMQDVTLAAVAGKAVIGGVKCDHLLFSRPGVDFQVWVADSGKPLPYKYVVTDTGYPELLSISTVLSDWNVAPGVPNSKFTFVPPPGAKPISFMPFNTASTANQ